MFYASTILWIMRHILFVVCVPVCHRCCVGEAKFFVNSLPMLHRCRRLETKPSLNGGVKHNTLTNTVRTKDNYAKIFRRTFYFCHVTGILPRRLCPNVNAPTTLSLQCTCTTFGVALISSLWIEALRSALSSREYYQAMLNNNRRPIIIIPG